MLGSTGTNMLRAQQLPVQAGPAAQDTAVRLCLGSGLAARNPLLQAAMTVPLAPDHSLNPSDVAQLPLQTIGVGG